MKVKVFKYLISRLGVYKGYGEKVGECINEDSIEKEINEFCVDKEIIDIKTNTFTTKNHNNGGHNEVYIVYTVMYK